SLVAGRSGKSGFAGDGGPAGQAELGTGDTHDLGIALDGAGDLYIADSGNNRIRRVGADGTINTIAGDDASGFVGDGGRASHAEFSHPTDVAVDGVGDVYVVDSGNSLLR